MYPLISSSLYCYVDVKELLKGLLGLTVVKEFVKV